MAVEKLFQHSPKEPKHKKQMQKPYTNKYIKLKQYGKSMFIDAP